METKKLFKIFSISVFTLMIQLAVLLYPNSKENETVFDNEKSSNELVAEILE